jgi:hypothetical protein
MGVVTIKDNIQGKLKNCGVDNDDDHEDVIN